MTGGSSDSRLNCFQLPSGPLFKYVAVTSCANFPAAKKDGGVSEVEVPVGRQTRQSAATSYSWARNKRRLKSRSALARDLYRVLFASACSIHQFPSKILRKLPP